MAAIDDASAEAALRLHMLVEMDARIVLVKPRRGHVTGFLDRHAVDMIDALAERRNLPSDAVEPAAATS